MKCRQAQDLIGAYLYGDLAVEEMRDLRVHAQDCAMCREDLASRGRVISSLDDTAPTLTDEDRLRIAWSVKGAVRKDQYQRKPLALRLAPTLALAGVLVAGIVVGRFAITRSDHPSTTRTATSPTGASVQVKELPPAVSNPKPNQTADHVSDLIQSLVNPTATIGPNRGTSSSRERERPVVIPPENPFIVAPEHQTPVTPAQQQPVVDPNSTIPKDSDPSVGKTESGTDSEAIQLPRVTDPKNAETSPSENK